MSTPFRFAACNEIFQKNSFAEGCSTLREVGYTGIEIAPFTLRENPAELPADERASIRQTIVQNGLSFVGLHWILMSPQGLHATTPDRAIRERTWQFIRDLAALAVDLNPDASYRPVLVFGSPKQRARVDGASHQEAMNIFVDELARIRPYLEERNVLLLIEPLSPGQCDVLNTLEEAARIIDQLGSPAIQTMFDVHNAIDEALPHAQLIQQYFPYIRHVHVNELDGQEPGRGGYDFSPVLATLQQLKYPGWVSLEAFDFSRSGRQIASGALNHLQRVLASHPTLQTL